MTASRSRPYRILIFDDDSAIREILWRYFNGREYEVFTFPHPQACPLCNTDACPCPIGTACADIIVTDFNMPFMKGMDFLEHQIAKGCKVKYMALVSGDLPDDVKERAKPHAIQLFTKPFSISDIDTWVNAVEAEIDPSHRLSDWYLGHS